MLGEKQKEKYVEKLRGQVTLPWNEALKKILSEAYEDGHAEGSRTSYAAGFKDGSAQTFQNLEDAFEAAFPGYRRVSHRSIAGRLICGNSKGA